MFKHILVERKEVDLDSFLKLLSTDPEIVNFMVKHIGSIEYSFVLESVLEKINNIKAQTPSPIEEDNLEENE